MEHHRGCSGRRAYEGRSGYCGLLFTRAGSVRDIAVVESQRPVSNTSTSRATIQSARKPPQPKVNHGIPEEDRDGDRGKNTRVGEPPGNRVGTTERSRGTARAWYTRVTARQRQGGRSEKKRRDPQRDSGWENKQAWEGTGRRDRGSTEKSRGHPQGACEQRGASAGGHPKKTKKQKQK